MAVLVVYGLSTSINARLTASPGARDVSLWAERWDWQVSLLQSLLPIGSEERAGTSIPVCFDFPRGK